MQRTVLAVCLCLLSAGLSGRDLISFESGDRTGFKDDDTGSEVIPARFKDAREFEDGFAAVTEDGDHWGFIGENGAWRLKPVYDDAGDFSEGLAWVSLDGHGQYISPSGKKVPWPPNQAGTAFHSGVAAVEMDQHWFLLKRDGSRTPLPDVNYCLDGGEGYTPCYDSGKKMGLKNAAGDWAIPPRFSYVYAPNGGMVQVDLDGKEGLWASSGSEVVPPVFDWISIGRNSAFSARAGGWNLVQMTDGSRKSRPRYSVQAYGVPVLCALLLLFAVWSFQTWRFLAKPWPPERKPKIEAYWVYVSQRGAAGTFIMMSALTFMMFVSTEVSEWWRGFLVVTYYDSPRLLIALNALRWAVGFAAFPLVWAIISWFAIRSSQAVDLGRRGQKWSPQQRSKELWRWLIMIGFPMLAFIDGVYTADSLGLSWPAEIATALAFLAVAQLLADRLFLWAWGSSAQSAKEVRSARPLERFVDKLKLPVKGIWLIGDPRDGIPNAVVVAGPVGRPRIFISRSLLRGLSLPQQKAVIAHELGHIVHGHIRKRFLLVVLLLILNGLISLLVFKLPGFSPWGSWLCLAVTLYVWLRFRAWYSRKGEYEADAYAAKVIGKSGVVAKALIRLHDLAWLPEQWSKRQRRGMGHPSLKDRVERLMEMGKNPKLEKAKSTVG